MQANNTTTSSWSRRFHGQRTLHVFRDPDEQELAVLEVHQAGVLGWDPGTAAKLVLLVLGEVRLGGDALVAGAALLRVLQKGGGEGRGFSTLQSAKCRSGACLGEPALVEMPW